VQLRTASGRIAGNRTDFLAEKLTMEPDRRLYRSSDNRVIAGVASGFADYFGIDATVARVVFGILLITGIGIPLYVLCWLIVPREPSEVMLIDDGPRPSGIVRTVLQVLVLLVLVAIINEHAGQDWAILTFVIGLAIGAFFLVRNRDARIDEDDTPTSLYRSRVDRKVLGVFGGLSEILRVDATLLRIAGVVLLFAAFPVTLALYLLYAFLVPVRRAIAL
jgi:phage shock protein PspC (stress-responsive transcriptional regulator)